MGRAHGVDLVGQARARTPPRSPSTPLPAAARGHDVVVIDTAGRLHTHKGLMDELKGRPRRPAPPDAPHETLLMLDATTGQNAIRQAKVFRPWS